MKLFSVTDCEPDPDFCFGWWEGVWAKTEAEALDWAVRNYGGELREYERKYQVANVTEQSENVMPAESGVHREGRMQVLRQAGWRSESETECESCELYACGMEEFRVCGDCYLCPECRESGTNESCSMCEA